MRELHSWHLGDERANEAAETATAWLMRPRGAYVMGRNMFGPIRGAWAVDWRGWWGPEPPYHASVFVLTNHARKPIDDPGNERLPIGGIEAFGNENGGGAARDVDAQARMCVGSGECSTSTGSSPRGSTPSKIRSPDPSRNRAMSSVNPSTPAVSRSAR